MEMWSKSDLISHIYDLENRLQVYGEDSREDLIAKVSAIFRTTAKESALLLSLMDGRLHTKENILQRIYIDRPDEAPELKIIDVFVCKIRRKVSKWGIIIQTNWGRGYRLESADRLKRYLDGEPLELVPIPEPAPVVGLDHSEHEDTGANLIAVFTVIREMADTKNTAIFTSRTITSKAGIKVKVQPYINKLHRQRYIRIAKRPDPYDPATVWKVVLLKSDIRNVTNLRNSIK